MKSILLVLFVVATAMGTTGFFLGQFATKSTAPYREAYINCLQEQKKVNEELFRTKVNCSLRELRADAAKHGNSTETIKQIEALENETRSKGDAP